MKITIKDKEIELKYSLRALMMFENINDKSFSGGSVTETMTFFWCVVVASSKDYTLGIDEFIDYIDEHQELLQEFNDWLMSNIANQNQLKKE